MKIFRLFLVFALLFCCISSVSALKNVIATDKDIARLKNDVKNGLIVRGKTRLKTIRDNYGDAPSITDSEKRIVYEYGELRLEFDKEKYWKAWSYDTFKKPVYTDDVDDLRYDLESEELVGNNITYEMIYKDYGPPTESDEKHEDGQLSIYYYGNIKMVFENVYLLSRWIGKNLADKKVTE